MENDKSDNAKHDEWLRQVATRLMEASTRQEEKLNILRQYYSPSLGIIYFLFLRLPNGKIKEICEKYRAKKNYNLDELLDELLTLNKYEISINRYFPGEPKQFTLSEMETIENNLNTYWRKELTRWIEVPAKAAIQLESIAKSVDKNSARRRLRKMVKSLEHLKRFKRFDRTKYDPDIFKAADKRFDKANRFEKKLGNCLLAELMSRNIAKKDFEETEEFLNWYNAYKQFRSDQNKRKAEVKSISPKR
jgi:hypothetical protein